MLTVAVPNKGSLAEAAAELLTEAGYRQRRDSKDLATIDAENDVEVEKSNIMLIGPTGVGKTEIARRLARLAGAPFIKVEASKFTEVGYVGRDVESIVREIHAHSQPEAAGVVEGVQRLEFAAPYVHRVDCRQPEAMRLCYRRLDRRDAVGLRRMRHRG